MQPADQVPNVDDSNDFDQLRRRGRALVAAGQLDEALALYEEGERWARAHGRPEQVDLMRANHCAIRIATDVDATAADQLRRTLLRATDARVQAVAAHGLSVFAELRKDHQRQLFYARIALEHATALDDVSLCAASHNQLGNALVADSHFAEAHTHYAAALERLTRRGGLREGQLHGNLGYCAIVEGHITHGFAHLFHSLRLLRRVAARDDVLALAHLDLCFAYLEIDRPLRALRHGGRALELAENAGADAAVKHALCLLGQAARATGDAPSAQRYFRQLQGRFYAHHPFLSDILMRTNVLKMINLRA
ncbi:MAG: hypothetical protein AAF772_12250 [Acidobacteriota bacterium]